MLRAALGAACAALVLAPPSAPQAGAWHGCLRPGERHGFVRTADGTRIAYAETGRGTSGIVFAHGARGDLCDFVSLLRDPRLKRYRMIAFDFRGGGLSDYPPYPKSARYRQDVIAAVERLRH